MQVEIGEHPITLCSDGVAAGISPPNLVRSRVRTLQKSTPIQIFDEMLPFRRLAQAKIALAFFDLVSPSSRDEAEYNRSLAQHFLLSTEIFFWCDMAGLNAADVRNKAKQTIENH